MIFQLLLLEEIITELIFGLCRKARLWIEWKILISAKKVGNKENYNKEKKIFITVMPNETPETD